MLLPVALLLSAVVPASALTEQEVLDRLAERVRSDLASSEAEHAIQVVRLSVSVQIAEGERRLQVRIAEKQLGADLAEASVNLAAAPAPAAQARAQYVQAIAQALAKFQQVLAQAHNQWAQDGSAAWNRFQQEANTTLQTAQQAVQTAQQQALQSLQGADPNVAPVINKTLPQLAAPATEGDPMEDLQKALAESRARYQKDVEAAFTSCDQELEAALNLPQGGDISGAMRKAINKLKIDVLDRHDQYKAEAGAALRKALLKALG
jgi:hypothetical protein